MQYEITAIDEFGLLRADLNDHHSSSWRRGCAAGSENQLRRGIAGSDRLRGDALQRRHRLYDLRTTFIRMMMGQ